MSFIVKELIEILENNTHLLWHLQELSEALNRYIWFRKVLSLLI